MKLALTLNSASKTRASESYNHNGKSCPSRTTEHEVGLRRKVAERDLRIRELRESPASRRASARHTFSLTLCLQRSRAQVVIRPRISLSLMKVSLSLMKVSLSLMKDLSRPHGRAGVSGSQSRADGKGGIVQANPSWTPPYT